ncbi:hypothetical protein ACTFIR_010629 [Dictyostelium discoideum]
MSTSPTIKKIERINYINKLITELETINKQNDLIIAQVPNQIQDSYNIITRFIEHVEDYKPQNLKNLSKSNIKIMELEKSINQLKTKIKDTQMRTNNVTSQKDLERELQFKLNQLEELRKKSLIETNNTVINNNNNKTTSVPSSSSSSSSSSSLSSLTTTTTTTTPVSITSSSSLSSAQIIVNNNLTNNDKLKAMKSDLKNLTVSIQKIYQCTTIFYQSFKSYFNTLGEVLNRIPTMRGGLDIGGVLQIGGDESTEILERMCESIYQSSKLAWTFLSELPCLEKSWYNKNFKIYQSILEKTEKDSSFDDKSPSSSSSSNNNNNDKKYGILNVLKRLKKKKTYRGSINLLEKITIMESESEIQQKLNNSPPMYSKQQQQQQHQQAKIGSTGLNNNNDRKVIVYEPINSSTTLLDAIILDLDKLLSFSDREITSHIDSLEKKSQMLIDILNLLKMRYQYFREKISRWVDNNSAILRVTSFEADPESFKIMEFKNIPDVQFKVKILYKVMLSYFTCCLVATPMVYLTPESWKLSNHSDFRAEKRKQIEKLLLVLKSNVAPIDLDVLRKLILEFTDILICALDIQIPLLLEVYSDDSSTSKRVNYKNEKKLLKETITKSINQLKYFQPQQSSLSSSFGISTSNNNNPVFQELLGNSVQMIQSVMLHFFKMKPIGRPHVYAKDGNWSLVSESKRRYEYRTSILI